MTVELNKLDTEKRNTRSMNIDTLTTYDMVELINSEDKRCAEAVNAVLPEIARSIDVIYDKLRNGGRLFYCGAGTSGRLGVLDAAECPPTYGVEPDLTIFGKVIAGGYPGAGGIGGKKQYMQYMGAGLDASGMKIKKAFCGGTMAATPLSCVAGYYTLEEIDRQNACQKAGEMGDRLTKGLQELIKKYNLPFVAFNQGSVCHIDTVGTMHYSINWCKPWTIPNVLSATSERKKEMQHMGAAYMAEGLVTLAGSRLYTNACYTPELIDEAINRFDKVFANVAIKAE